MLYAAKCYWPGVSRADLDAVAARFDRIWSKSSDPDLAYRGSLLFSEDELVLCLFEGSSRSVVKRASDRIGIPCERVMDSVWLKAGPGKGER